MINGMVMPLAAFLVEECGYSEAEAGIEEYMIGLEILGVDLDEIYRAPTEEERLESLLRAA